MPQPLFYLETRVPGPALVPGAAPLPETAEKVYDYIDTMRVTLRGGAILICTAPKFGCAMAAIGR